MALWDYLFGQVKQPIAQVFLTRGDISDVGVAIVVPRKPTYLPQQRTRYLNAANTLRELLSMGVVPIINENDTVSVGVRSFQHWGRREPLAS